MNFPLIQTKGRSSAVSGRYFKHVLTQGGKDTDQSVFHIINAFIPQGGLRKKTVFDKILMLGRALKMLSANHDAHFAGMIFQTSSRVNAEDIQVDKLLDEIESYWSTRTDGYSEVNEKELKGMQKAAWLETLECGFWGEKKGKELTSEEKKQLRILDIGTGPGFFPMILAEAGYHVTAVDYTPGMLEKARENAAKFIGEKKEQITFKRMDAQALEFADESFDVIISRNLTWNLPHPEAAYKEWLRVLKKGGKLLNFDANWYGYLYDDRKREAYENDRKNVEKGSLDDHYLCTDIDRMEKIAMQVPLSELKRPAWDIKVLEELGAGKIDTDEEIWQQVWSQEEKLNYGSTPMFMIQATK